MMCKESAFPDLSFSLLYNSAAWNTPYPKITWSPFWWPDNFSARIITFEFIYLFFDRFSGKDILCYNRPLIRYIITFVPFNTEELCNTEIVLVIWQFRTNALDPNKGKLITKMFLVNNLEKHSKEEVPEYSG